MKPKITLFIKILLLIFLSVALYFTTKYSLKYMHWLTKSSGYPGLYTIEEEYEFEPISPRFLADSKWHELASDEKRDGDIPNWPDAKSLAVFRTKDTVWLKYSFHNNIDINEPMVTMAIEDNENGTNWYGNVKNFKYKEMISVGFVRKKDNYYGYNFVENKNGVCRMFYSLYENCLILAIPSYEILKFRDNRFVASVGQKGLWNDDFDQLLNVNQLLIEH